MLKYRLGNRVVQFIQRLSIIFLNFAFGSRSLPSGNQTLRQRHSLHVGKKQNIDMSKLNHNWEENLRKFIRGEHFSAVKSMKEIMGDIYEHNKLDLKTWEPPFIDNSYIVSIGHRGFLGWMLLAKKLGLNSPRKPTVLYKDAVFDSNLEILFGDEVDFIPSNQLASQLSNPVNWHLAQQVMIPKVGEDFFSVYEMHERIFQEVKNAKLNLLKNFSNEYNSMAKKKLRNLGWNGNNWFVALQIRENNDQNDERNVNPLNYLKAIDEILHQGGQVIRFGKGKVSPLPKRKGLIDLSGRGKNFVDLHAFIINECAFFINTNSGPSTLAWFLGKPVLQTNVIGVGNKILTATKNTIYLPKIYLHKGSKMSLNQLLSSTEGYNEFVGLKDRAIRGFEVVENSELDILNATKDILNAIFNPTFMSDSKLDSLVNKIRISNGAYTKGYFAPSFLEANHDWFLK